MKWLRQVYDIMATRIVGIITLASLSLVAWGIAIKLDVATAAIVVGAILLLDLSMDGRAKGPPE